MLEAALVILIVLTAATYLARRWWRSWVAGHGGCHGAGGRPAKSRPQQITLHGRPLR